MMIRKNILKNILLGFLILLIPCGISVNAAEEEIVTGELVDLQSLWGEADEDISLLSLENGMVDLKPGNHERWIDRIELPDYALKMYAALEEYCDNDGNKDYMITEEAYSKSHATVINFPQYNKSDTFNAIECVTLNNPSQKEIDYTFKLIQTTYKAFEQDHPEVFWLSMNSKGYALTIGTSNNFKVKFYFMIKMHDGSYSSAFDARHTAYQYSGAVKRDVIVRDQAISSILNTDSIRYASTEYDKVRALNSWLTKNNQYNTLYVQNPNYHSESAHECLSALKGSYGENGPVCEAYSKAFKVLCDKLNIVCVISTGKTYHGPNNNLGNHAWNCVRVNGVWYSSDITWNDPVVAGSYGPLSGRENEKYLLVGEQTVIDGDKYKTTHITTNLLATNGFSLNNEPLVSDDSYINEAISKTPADNRVIRLAGNNRYATSVFIADKFREKLNVSRFGTIIIASGKNFADALAGSYLASKTNAPIVITNGNNVYDIKDYVIKNLKTGGTVYLLGGNAAVPEIVENCLYGFGNIKRLAGTNRYETNLEILEEAGVTNEDIFICTGKDFADSLSASAAKRPILLVGKSLSTAQTKFLNKLNGNRIYIIGGTSAVNDQIAAKLRNYGPVERISGSTRYETSTLFARKFFNHPTQIVLAYAKNFPDGLCGSSLAMAMDAPLILTATGKEQAARDYSWEKGISSGVVLGGTSLISDNSTSLILGKYPILP